MATPHTDLTEPVLGAPGSGVDLAALSEWMDGQGLGSGPIEGLSPLGGGTQNIIVRFSREGRSYVLRRGPRHLRPKSNDDLRNEMRVLAALSGTDVPHARLIAGCPDPEVLDGAVFYLMEPVDGINASVELTDLHAQSPELRHGMGLALVDALAALGEVDHLAAGLDGLGRPEGFLERQVQRWLSQLESYSEHATYPGPRIPGVDGVADWLDRNRPTSWTPGILHGDYHVANVMYSRTGPEVVAIVDWEMCTIGDPLLDLGWVLATGPRAGEPGDLLDSQLGRLGGLPSPDELVRRYAERSSRDVSAIDWYTVLACFKLGVVLEGTYARSLAGKAPADVGERLHGLTLRLFERAQSVIAGRPGQRTEGQRRD